MKLIMLPNIKLRQKSEEVNIPVSMEDDEIAKKMIKYIKDSKVDTSLRAGIGIAAVQLGYLKRMFYVNFEEDENGNVFEEFLINPKIIAESTGHAALEGGEGCLSVEDTEETKGLVHRKNKVVIEGYSYLKMKQVKITKTGFAAIVLQHEYDHLDGNLFFDRIDKKNV